jgi:hypothetical protein
MSGGAESRRGRELVSSGVDDAAGVVGADGEVAALTMTVRMVVVPGSVSTVLVE